MEGLRSFRGRSSVPRHQTDVGGQAICRYTTPIEIQHGKELCVFGMQ